MGQLLLDIVCLTITWGGRGGPGKEGEDLGRNERGVGGTAVNHEAGNLTVIPIYIHYPAIARHAVTCT